MILPYFEYGSVFLEICTTRLKEKINRVFERGIRIALSNYDNVPLVDLYNEIKLLPLKFRRFVCINKSTYRKVSNGNGNVIQNIANTRMHDAPALNWPHLSNDRFMQFVPYLGPTLWTDLPAHIRNCENINTFTSHLKEHYKTKFINDPVYR